MEIGDGVRRAFLVKGRVQGVGFRWWTRKTAGTLGLAGTVRNCPDGSVEVRVEGSPEAVMEMERRLHRGPGSARVDEVGVLDEEPNINRKEFEILR